MKICLVNNLYPPVIRGGTEVVVETTLQLLREQGHEVSLITTQPGETDQEWTLDESQGFPIYRFRPHNLYYYTEGNRQPVYKKLLWHAIDIWNPRDATTLRRILTQIKPELVHGHNLKGISYTLPNVARGLGIPYVHTLHNYQLLHPYGTFFLHDTPPFFKPKVISQLYQACTRAMFKHVDAVISPSALPLQLHAQVGFFKDTLTEIIPSPVLEYTATEAPALSKTLRFVYMGAIEEFKGIRSLLAAFQQLPIDQVQLDIYGDGSLRTQLEAAARSYPHIHWLGYLQDKNQLQRYHALIYPSICYETQGLSMAEALVRGVPVIAAQIGSIPETVIPGLNGWLYPSNDVAALKSLIERIIADPGQLDPLRLGAIQSRVRFSPAAYIDKQITLYQRVLQKKKR